MNNELYITFLLEDGDGPNNYVNVPLEINNDFGNSYIEYFPVRRLPTIHVKMKTINIRRPTIYINGDGSDWEKSLTNNNIYNSQNPIHSMPITNNHIIKNQNFTKVTKLNKTYNSPEKVKKINYYNSPLNSPEREKIEFIYQGSPSKNQFNYSSYKRKEKTNINNYYEGGIKSAGSTSDSSFEEKSKEYEIQILNGLKAKNDEIELKLGKIISFLTDENKKLKEENILLKNKISNDNFDENAKQILDEKDKKIQELELLLNEKEKEIYSLKVENENSLKQIDIYKNELNRLNSENEKLTKITQFKGPKKIRIVKGEIIQNNKELEFLTQRICKGHKKITLNLLYKATVDSDKANIFHRRCDNASSSLVLIKSSNNKRFGGFTSCNWAGNCEEKKDDNAFIFSLDKMKIYDVIKNESAIGCFPNFGPLFLGCQIRIYDNAFINGGSTFEKNLNYQTQEDYELTGGLQKFGVKEIEVYGVDIEN